MNLKRKSTVVYAIVMVVLASAIWVGNYPIIDDRGMGDAIPRKVIEGFLVPALENFERDVGRYPTEEEGLLLLLSVRVDSEISEKWKGPYLVFGPDLMDPWRRSFQYETPGRRSGKEFDVYSFGPDREHSDDDIGNWIKN